jgi:hypothetical protein
LEPRAKPKPHILLRPVRLSAGEDALIKFILRQPLDRTGSRAMLSLAGVDVSVG